MKKVFLLISFLLVFPYQIFSQQVSLGISPPLVEVKIKPGKSILIGYQIQNFGDPVYLQVKVLPFEPKDNYGRIKLKNKFTGPIQFSLDNAAIELEKPFFLESNKIEQLLLKIKTPEITDQGDYYYSLLIETLPPTYKEGIASAQAKTTIASNILITVTKNGLIDVKPKNVIFTTGKKYFDSFETIPLTFIIANLGKNLIQPQGKIILKGNFGEKTEFNIIPKNILSQSQRLIEATPSGDLTLFKEPKTLVLPKGFYIGKYILSAEVNFGENSPKIFTNTIFFAFPFKLFFGLILILTLVIFIIKKFEKKES